jgi:small subunit ribosomal protein YMR-31
MLQTIRIKADTFSSDPDFTPRPHPESPSATLPESFAAYREKATQHGPLKTQNQPQSSTPSAASQKPQQSLQAPTIGAQSGRSLGSVKPAHNQFWDRNDLPQRFHRTPFTQAEIDAIETGGASLLA